MVTGGGANYSWQIDEFEEMYSQTFGGAIFCGNYMQFAIFLRGGGENGAIYHLYSDMDLEARNGPYDCGWDENLQKYVIGKLRSPQISYRTNYVQYKSDLCFGRPGNVPPDENGNYDDLQYKEDAPAPRDMVLSGDRYVRTSAQNEEIRIRRFIKLSQDNDTILKKTVKKVDVEYYLSTSSTECTGGSWSTTAPAWVDGKYMWSRQKVTFVDGTTSTTNTTCIAGAKGSTGSTGTGIDSITEEYYLSTSKTSQTGGSWVNSPPTWESGKYIWTRSKIVYKNPASTEYTTPLCSSEWEAVNEISIGGRNLLLNMLNFNFTRSDHGNINCSVNENGIITLIPINNGNVHNPNNKTSKDLIKGKTYTLSFETISPRAIGFYWYPSENYYKGGIIKASETWKKNIFVYTQTGNDKPATSGKLFGLYDLIAGETYKIRNIKLEEGNKATDWTPAPEDIDTNINQVQENLDNLEIGGRNLIRNSSFKFDLNDWKIGNSGQYQYELVSGYNDAKALKIVKGDASSHLAFYQFLNIIIKANTMLTASMKVKTISGNADNLYMRFNDTFSMPMKSKKVLDDGWVLYTYQGKHTADIDTESISFGPNGSAGEFIFDDLKLEYGNKPTDWTAAPEDTDTEIQLINTVLNGETGINARLTSAETTIDSIRGKIVNQVIDANGKVITTQTSNGLSINLSGITNDVSQLLSDMTTKEDSQDAQAARQLLQDQLSKLQNNTAFIRCYQELEKYVEDDVTKTRMVPIIELGSNTSPFHLKINNEGIYFVEGYPTFVLTTSEPSDWNTNYNDYYTLSEEDIYVQVQTLVAPTWEANKYYEKDTVNENIIAFANGKAFYNLKTVVQKEIKLGSTYDKDTQDFVGASWSWVSRENGNLGLVYSTGQTNS